MSDSIAIPRNGKQRASIATMNSTSSASSSVGTPSTSAREKGKMVARTSSAGSWAGSPWGTERRASLLSSSISRSEHTVVNIGDPDGVPRLITCVKASQGFDWNQDIFLPSYASEHDHTSDLELRQDPVEDIFISDEEAEGMFPR